jgi:hypothetical protein
MNFKGSLTIIVFLLMVYALAGIGILQEDKTYSSSENRVLQTFPKISEKKVLKGKFQKKYETYLSDQFPARDGWIQVKSRAERLLGKTESNGVYFGKNKYLLEKYTKEDFDKKQGKKNVQALKTFVEGILETGQGSVKVMMVPSKTDILEQDLPMFAQSYDEGIFYQQLEEALPAEVLVPVKEALNEHDEEYIYYRNDHHWTTLGAWYGYEAYLTECGGEEQRDSAEKKKEALKSVSTDFLGTTYSKVNMYFEADEIFVYEPEGDFSVDYNLGEKTEDTFFQWEYLEKKDQYSVFSGGNQGVLEITGGEKNGRTLFVVKDSFANCLIPFLMEDYEKVVVVDMRQLNVGLSMVMRMYEVTDVLVVYNVVQFMQDRDFAMKL